MAKNQMIGLVQLFDGRLPDAEAHRHLAALVVDTNRWREARGYFSEIRRRRNATNDPIAELQYTFTEACLKTIYNETSTSAPFDSISPFWVVPTALDLAAELGFPPDSVATCLAEAQQPPLGENQGSPPEVDAT